MVSANMSQANASRKSSVSDSDDSPQAQVSASTQLKKICQRLQSSVGRKYIMALTGLGLTFFMISHVLANLQLFFNDKGDAFNRYAHGLMSLGNLLLAIEGGLALVFIVHIFTAISLNRNSKQARSSHYEHSLRSKGGASHSNLSSRNMLLTGLGLTVFLIIHILQFRLGWGPNFFASSPELAATTTVDGVEMRNLYALVQATFAHPGWVIFYCLSIVLFGFHLRHGFWSLFQSLGIFQRWGQLLYMKGTLLAGLMALGFFMIPIYFYFFAGSGN